MAVGAIVFGEYLNNFCGCFIRREAGKFSNGENTQGFVLGLGTEFFK